MGFIVRMFSVNVSSIHQRPSCFYFTQFTRLINSLIRFLSETSGHNVNNILNLLINQFNFIGFPGGSVVKNLLANAGHVGDVSLSPESGSSPGEGNGNPLQYFCLENPMDKGDWQATVHGVAKSRRRLSMHAHQQFNFKLDNYKYYFLCTTPISEYSH